MPGDAGSDKRVAEWQEARNIISGTDGRLATLRQYGMSFVAGLLAAQGLIEFQQATSNSSYVPSEVKFAILVASLLLIGAIYDVDRRELAIQEGAVDRARELETELGFKLTSSITETYRSAHEFSLTNALYILFVAATALLGFAVLNPVRITFNLTTDVFLLAALLVALAIIADMLNEHVKRRAKARRAGTVSR